MRRYTQSTPFNCWQTCVACVLEIDPNRLPLQSYCYPYMSLLGPFLRDEYRLRFVRFRPADAPASPHWQFLSGKTVRTAKSGETHMVVGRMGRVIWDPYPTHAGLTELTGISYLIRT